MDTQLSKLRRKQRTFAGRFSIKFAESGARRFSRVFRGGGLAQSCLSRACFMLHSLVGTIYGSWATRSRMMLGTTALAGLKESVTPEPEAKGSLHTKTMSRYLLPFSTYLPLIFHFFNDDCGLFRI